MLNMYLINNQSLRSTSTATFSHWHLLRKYT